MKTILLVENDAETSEMMVIVLTDAGYKVVKSDSKISLPTLLTLNPDLIILDHLITGGFGGDYCSDIKANPLTKHFPVIMISATSGLNSIAEKACADDYINKPFDVDDLVSQVNKLAL